jgi:hypothetical protein
MFQCVYNNDVYDDDDDDVIISIKSRKQEIFGFHGLHVRNMLDQLRRIFLSQFKFIQSCLSLSHSIYLTKYIKI